MMTSHVLTICTVASLLLVGQYARLLLANEVTTEVSVSPQTCSLHEPPLLTDLGQTQLKSHRKSNTSLLSATVENCWGF